jgi:hypothetical protein
MSFCILKCPIKNDYIILIKINILFQEIFIFINIFSQLFIFIFINEE